MKVQFCSSEGFVLCRSKNERLICRSTSGKEGNDSTV